MNVIVQKICAILFTVIIWTISTENIIDLKNTAKNYDYSTNIVIKQCSHISEEDEQYIFDMMPKWIDIKSYLVGYSFSHNLHRYIGNTVMNFTVSHNYGINTIGLHSKYNNITSFSISQQQYQINTAKINNDNLLEIKDICYLKHKLDHLIISFNRFLTKNVLYSLNIEFNGVPSIGMNGIYISHYNSSVNNGGKIEDGNNSIISTHFEPESARQAFPCFDTPSMKAKYTIYLTHATEYSSYSNMPVHYIKLNNDGTKTVFFQQTPLMSSYLVAFTINKYSVISKRSNSFNKINVRVLLPEYIIEQGRFALDVAVNALELFENITKIPFALKKLDLIGIPSFSAGAMENWGLITFRLTQMVYNDNTVTVVGKQYIAATVVHELSHQWFGNYVTMKSWKDIWLNEGFATFMENYGVDQLFPEWNMFEEMKFTVYDSGMSTDQLVTTHAIVVGKNNTADTRSYFDSISYSKAGSFLFMLHNVMGNDKFWITIQKYLKTFAYNSATSLNFLNMASNEMKTSQQREMVYTWALNKGFPYVTVNYTNNSNYENNVELSQNRFILTSEIIKFNESKELWSIPISYTIRYNDDSEPEHKVFWLTDRKMNFSVNKQISWIKFNTNRNGFYVVNYHNEGWNNLINALKLNLTVLSPLDKVGLLDDSMRLNRNGFLTFNVPLNLIKILLNDQDFYVSLSTINHLEFIGWEINDDSYMYSHFKNYYVSYLHQKYYSLKNELNNSRRQPLLNEVQNLILKSLIKSICVDYNCYFVVKELLSLYDLWKSNKQTVEPSTLTSVLKSATMYGTKEDTKHIENLYVTTTDPHLKRKLLHALAFVQDSDLLHKYLNMSIYSNFVDNQDLTSFISTVASNPIGKVLAWNFIKTNWKAIHQKMVDSDDMVSNLLPSVVGQFKSSKMIDEVKTFYNQFNSTIFKNDYIKTMQKLQINIDWNSRNQQFLKNFLD